MVLPWRTLIFAHMEECRPWRTLIFAHMILSRRGDSEQSQANYRNSLDSRCLVPTLITVTHQSTIHAVFQILCSRIHTSARTESQRKLWYSAHALQFFAHFGTIVTKLVLSRVNIDGERQRITTRLLNRRRRSLGENDWRFWTRRITRETSAIVTPSSRR